MLVWEARLPKSIAETELSDNWPVNIYWGPTQCKDQNSLKDGFQPQAAGLLHKHRLKQNQANKNMCQIVGGESILCPVARVVL